LVPPSRVTSLIDIFSCTFSIEMPLRPNNRAIGCFTNSVPLMLFYWDNALAASLTSVEASVNDATASGLFKVIATAAPTGVDAHMALFVRAAIEEVFKDAGIFLDANGVASGITMVADKFVIGDGADTGVPFVVRDSELAFDGVIRSTDNNHRIDPRGETFIYLET
ncbi:MAG: hypothetical protein GY761_09015, partial [Hyphomicrobiales bacterium]|nr:hypothetical protein [Hyphomicrobiales bacterium]